MTLGAIAETLRTLRAGWSDFFHSRCLVGFPWFWPARPPGMPAMVAARRMARRQFGRDRRRLHRALAQVFAAIAWPPSRDHTAMADSILSWTGLCADQAHPWGALGRHASQRSTG